MLTRRQSLLALLSLLIAPSAFAADGGPDKVVAGLYQRMLKNPDLPSFGVRKSDHKLLSKSLQALWAKSEAKRKRLKDELGPLGFDVVTDSQTGDVKSYDLIITELTAGTATVMARFNRGNDYAKAERIGTVEYRLVKETAWKIDEVRGRAERKAWSLREILDAYLNNPKF